MRIVVDDFTLVEQTAFLTEYARALDNRSQHPILSDALADEIVEQIDYDFAGFRMPASVIRQTALRAKMLDERAVKFTTRHPEAIVVDLGAGLSTAMLRVQPPATVDWYSIDLPRVIALRDKLVPAVARAHSVAADLTSADWTDTIPAGRPTMLIADGLFAFLPEPEVTKLFVHITGHFGSGELAFNDYGRVGPFSRLAMKLARRGMFSMLSRVWANPGFTDPQTPQRWNPRLRLVEQACLAHATEVESFPGMARTVTKVAGRFKVVARRARVLRYRF
ncbi:MAG TPA: class I SAM-dependent methyltransferase [Mycobacterium sp.]|nr:class I SAM-dependent methyltransferase [Mycobacterium sp.]